MSRCYNSAWGVLRNQIVSPVLIPGRILFVRAFAVGMNPDRLQSYNPRELLYGRGYDIEHPEIAPDVIRQGIYDSLLAGIVDNGRIGVDTSFDGILVLDFEDFKPTPTFERLENANLQYYKANNPITYPTPYAPLSDEEYTLSMSTFWSGALEKYKQVFSSARFAMYQAPRAFNYSLALTGTGWFQNQALGPDVETLQTNFDVEAAWLYPLLDVIAIHDYMAVSIGGPNNPTLIKNFHRDLAIRGIRVAREYRKPCLAYFFQFYQGGGGEVGPSEMQTWFDGYLAALANTDGGWPMMGISFWIGDSDPEGNVILANTFLRDKFLPAFIERFTIGTKTGIGGVIPAWP